MFQSADKNASIELRVFAITAHELDHFGGMTHDTNFSGVQVCAGSNCDASGRLIKWIIHQL